MTPRSSWWANQPSTSLLHLSRRQSGPQRGVRAQETQQNPKGLLLRVCVKIGWNTCYYPNKCTDVIHTTSGREAVSLSVNVFHWQNETLRRVQSWFSVAGALSLTVLSPQHQWRPCSAFPVRPWRQTPIPPSHPEQRWMGTFAGTGSGAPSMQLLDPGQFYKWSRPIGLQWAGTLSSAGSSHVMATLAFQIKFLSSSAVLRFGSFLWERTDFHLILTRMDVWTAKQLSVLKEDIYKIQTQSQQ